MAYPWLSWHIHWTFRLCPYIWPGEDWRFFPEALRGVNTQIVESNATSKGPKTRKKIPENVTPPVRKSILPGALGNCVSPFTGTCSLLFVWPSWCLNYKKFQMNAKHYEVHVPLHGAGSSPKPYFTMPPDARTIRISV